MRILIVLVTLIAPTALAAQSNPAPGQLAAAIEAELGQIPANTGLYLKHLKTGEEVAVRADVSFNSQSVIKIPIMVRAFQLAEQGKLNLDERVTIGRAELRDGSGVFQFADLGLAPTLRDLIQQMIITSDNTATDLAIAKVGGVARVNAWLKEHGYGDSLRLTQTTGELFAKYGALPQGANRNEKTNADRAYWLGEMTPRATGRMLEALHRNTLASQKSSEEMIRFMRAQQAGARRLPHFVTVPIAHKTGDFPPVLANDVGIALTPSGPIVISFFLNEITGAYGEAEDRIGRVAQLVVQYFDGVR
jgi:beta-lactamase class A